MFYAVNALTVVNARRVIAFCDNDDPDRIETVQIKERAIRRLMIGQRERVWPNGEIIKERET